MITDSQGFRAKRLNILPLNVHDNSFQKLLLTLLGFGPFQLINRKKSDTMRKIYTESLHTLKKSR